MGVQINAMSKAKAVMIVRHPFYASFLFSTPLIEESPPADAKPDKKLGYAPTRIARWTACTDMRSIWYNADFIKTLQQDVVIFVLVHEVMHIVLKHGLRMQGRNPRRWNQACDFAINWMLRKAGFVIWEHALCDPQYDGMSAEQIYELREQKFQQRLKQQLKKLKDGADLGPGEGPDGDGADPGPGDAQDGDGEPGEDDPFGNGKPKPGRRGEGTPDYGQDPAYDWDDLIEATEHDPDLKRKIEREIERKVAQAATIAKMQGKMPGDLERIVDGILNPPQRWQDILRQYMTAQARDDESWSRRDRRFPSVYLPGRYSERMGEIVIIGDTSGSVTDQELVQIGGEVREMAEVLKPERIRVIWADAKVQGHDVFEPGEAIELHPKGGGGTDMRVPLKEAEDYDPVVVLMFTDCATPWPASVPFPLIVLSSTNEKSPVGDTIPLRP